MIKITETKIVNITKNKFKDLKISFTIKKEDLTPELENKLFDLCEWGNLLAMWIQETEFTEDTGLSEREIKNKLLRKLAFLMVKYAEKENCDISNLKNFCENYHLNNHSVYLSVYKKEDNKGTWQGWQIERLCK